jgi:hypothetical protein
MSRKATSARIIIAALAIGGSACEPGVEQGRSYQLEEVARYGWLDMPADSLNLPPEARREGGGILGAIHGVFQADDSTVYVLDPQWKKIVAFAPGGSVLRVILGRAGEGPGEFMTPVDLAATADGLLAVLDYRLGRVSFLDPQGQFQHSINLHVGGLLRFAILGDSLWATRGILPGSEAPMARIFARSGDEIGQAPPLAERDRDFGGGVHLAVSDSRTLLLTLAQPGLWVEYSQGEYVRRGTELFPEMEPPREDYENEVLVVTPAQAQVAGLGMLNSDLVVQRYWRFTRPFDWNDPPSPEEIDHYIALFSATGDNLGTVRLHGSAQFGTKYMHVSRATGHIFVPAYDPYPMVIEYRLVESTEASGS